ncbi:hypothetical protein MPSEU_000897700 [Mayamaea pseudoterrestris]|nr:hypothetical protein MPSEU_000897700 [Mayamaea pseudoterrestris]
MTAESDTMTAKSKLHDAINDVKTTLTQAEAFFLRGLLLDPPSFTEDEIVEESSNAKDDERVEHMKRATKKLSDDMLFSTLHDVHAVGHVQQSPPPKPNRPSILGLWKAFADGVFPRALIRRASSHDLQQQDAREEQQEQASNTATVAPPNLQPQILEIDADDNNDLVCLSDEEIRPDIEGSVSSDSTWGDDDHWEHFDTWNVLKDEYAADVGGFDFDATGLPAVPGIDDDNQNIFLILGTSADDTSCHPHVLSPPLMDSLMSHVPKKIHNENYWLKFSLVRDGASLHTLQQYTRAATCTILAVETTQGQVFGSFTSSPWRNTGGDFYGDALAFVWKMRRGRRTKVASLYDQAHLEYDIDVFPYAASETTGGEASVDADSHVQVCRDNFLGVGGDYARNNDLAKICNDSFRTSISNIGDAIHNIGSDISLDQSGFALTLDSNLSTGTTSPCKTFNSPALCGKGDATEIFSIAGLEVWTFTPARDVTAAERLEMGKFFIEQSSRNMNQVDSSTSGLTCGYSPKVFSSRDLVQSEFYRRIGETAVSEDERLGAPTSGGNSKLLSNIFR